MLEGLKGRPIGELCAEHEISQGQYYQWRDQFLANASKAFEQAGCEMETFQYRRVVDTTDGVPWVVETAFGWCPDGEQRRLITGSTGRPASATRSARSDAGVRVWTPY